MYTCKIPMLLVAHMVQLSCQEVVHPRRNQARFTPGWERAGLIFKTASTSGRELFVLFRRFFILALTTPTARHDGPGGHPRTPSRPSSAGRGHQSHPQGSRRPEDNHTEMASLTCGTAAGDPHKSPPANPAGHSVPRVCVAGGNGPEAPG